MVPEKNAKLENKGSKHLEKFKNIEVIISGAKQKIRYTNDMRDLPTYLMQ